MVMDQHSEQVIEGEFRQLADNEHSSVPIVKIIFPNSAKKPIHRNAALHRRDFLALAGATAATFLGGILFGKATGESMSSSSINNSVNKSQDIIPPTSTAVRLPDAPFPDAPLEQTAVALENKGLKFSFQEKNDFTEEMFNEARRGTVIVQISGNKGSQSSVEGTGFVFRHKDNTVYIVTNKHIFLNLGDLTGVKIWRPNLDPQEYFPTKIAYSITQGDSVDSDIGVIKCTGAFPSNIPLPNIDYVEKQDLSGKDVLVVGFPGAFRKDKSELEAPILGSVMKVEGKFPGAYNSWIADGLTSLGSSGSPVFLAENNRLKLVGLMNAITHFDVITGANQIQNQWRTRIQTLEIQNLLDILKGY